MKILIRQKTVSANLGSISYGHISMAIIYYITL